MDFNPLTLIPGFVFGVVGWSIFQRGRQRVNYSQVFIGIAMMGYPYFVSDLLANWAIGFALSGLAYFLR